MHQQAARLIAWEEEGFGSWDDRGAIIIYLLV
jgi:hypothetical protein